MADSAETHFIFLDTEVFRAHQLDFESPNIRRLVKLMVEGPVKLLLTTVTKGEVMDDLKSEAQKAIKKLKEIRRVTRVMRKIMPEDAVEAIEGMKRDEAIAVMQTHFKDFIAETNAIVLDVDQVSSEGVFKNYFAGTPPFGGDGDNKKVEFPDAFACGALEAWSAENNNAKIYVVSNDSDWKKMCEGKTVLISVARLDELLQHFTDTEIGFAIKKGLDSQREELLKLVRIEAEMLDFYVGSDMLIEAEIDDYEILDLDITDFHIVEIKDGEASLSVFCEISVSADVVADDPDSGIKDSETKSVYYVFRMAGTITRAVEMMAEVSVNYDNDDPEQVTIESVEFEEKSIELFVEEQELERVDDNDYSDNMEAPEYEPGDLEPPDHEPPDR